MKRLLCLLICVCLLFVGCGPKTPDTNETGGTTGENAQSGAVDTDNSYLFSEFLGFAGAGSSVTPPERTSVDLMHQAIEASSFAGTGLKGFETKNYGVNLFPDYHELHGNPLYSAEYMLSNTALAKQVNNAAHFGAYFGEMLETYGARIENRTETWNADLDEALTKLFEAAGDTSNLQTAKQQAQGLDDQVKKPLAVFVNAAAEAVKAIKEQTAKAGKDIYTALQAFQFYTMTAGDMTSLSNMIQAYYSMDFKPILVAGRDMVAATGILARALENVTLDTAFTINTPAGDIIFGGKQDDTYTSPNALLLVDAGGNDTYNGRVASNTFENPVSVLIDIGGNDTYAGKEATQGCGILGVGVLMDMGGNDTYTAKNMAQACAIVGVGALYDQNGDDQYNCDVTAQAAGHYGMAVLFDGAGNDSYKAVGMAQASVGNACQAYLVDISGDDTYYVTSEVVKGYEGMEYDLFEGSVGNNSQGCAWGQRNVESPERGIAGGIAGLIDIRGNDKYEGGLWVMGCGYWSGVGFLVDTAGDDRYTSCYYSQASVAHYGVGMLADIGGNDVHELVKYGGGAGFGFVWDRGLGVFIDDGGDDVYVGEQSIGGVSWSAYDEKGIENQDMNYAIFIDTAGRDKYCKGDYKAWGIGRGGYFIDAGGADEQVAPEPRANNKHYTGIFMDDPNAGGEAHFWENAKLKYLG